MTFAMRKVTAVFWIPEAELDDDLSTEDVQSLARWSDQGAAVLARIENEVFEDPTDDEDWNEECQGRFGEEL